MLKLKGKYTHDDVAAGRRQFAHQSDPVQSVREATTASGVDNAASPDWQTPLNKVVSPQREADHYARKNNWKEPRSILMSSADRVAHIDGQLMQYCEQYTRFQRMPKVIKPSNPFTNVCWVSVYLNIF